jgi:HlyD family secretion protein
VKKAIPVILIAAVAAGALLWFFVLRGPVQRHFQYVQIQRGDIDSTISCTGTLQFYYTVNIQAYVSGTVVKWYADFNQKVKKGDLLAKLDDTSFILDVKTAEEALDKDKVALDQANENYSNTKALFDQGFKSTNDLHTDKYTLDTALETYISAKNDLDKARLNLEWTKIVSTVDGMILQRNIDIGSAVTAQGATPPFVVANDIVLMQVLASVDESDISKVKVGEKVRFTVQAYPDRTFKGVVSQIRLNTTSVQNVVNYSVMVDVDNKDGALLPGMTATMDMVTENRTNVLKVANAALKFRPPQDLLRELAKKYTNLAALTNTRRQFTQGGFGGPGGFGGMGGGPGGFGGMGGGPGGFGGIGGASGQPRATNGVIRRTNTVTLLWVDDGKGGIRPMRVRTGLTDGTMTEILSTNVTEGMQIVSGMQTNASAAASHASSPFQQTMSQQGGGNRGSGLR